MKTSGRSDTVIFYLVPLMLAILGGTCTTQAVVEGRGGTISAGDAGWLVGIGIFTTTMAWLALASMADRSPPT